MRLISPCYSCFAFLAGALSLLPTKVEMNYTEYSTSTKAHDWNSTAVYAENVNWSLPTARTQLSAVLQSDNTSHQAFLGSKESVMTADTKTVPFPSNGSTTTNGFELSSSATTEAQHKTSTSNIKSSAVNLDNCKEETHRGTLVICIIIIAVLVLLCTFLLIAIVLLANQVANLKNAAQSKRQTRNNGDFLTISSSLWPGGADQWNKSSQLLTGTNQSMEDLSFDGTSTTKEQNKDGTTKKIKEPGGKSKDEHQPENATSPSAHEDSVGQTLSEDLKCSSSFNV